MWFSYRYENHPDLCISRRAPIFQFYVLLWMIVITTRKVLIFPSPYVLCLFCNTCLHMYLFVIRICCITYVSHICNTCMYCDTCMYNICSLHMCLLHTRLCMFVIRIKFCDTPARCKHTCSRERCASIITYTQTYVQIY